MTTATFSEDIEKTLKFEPIKGRLNEYVIRAKKPLGDTRQKDKMSAADWDKFEKDIAIVRQSS